LNSVQKGWVLQPASMFAWLCLTGEIPLADALGATTNWYPDTQQVTVSTPAYNISMTIGSTTMTVNRQAQTLDQSPVINNGRTYLPARDVANALGYQVDWNATNKIVTIWPNSALEPDYSNIIGQVAAQ